MTSVQASHREDRLMEDVKGALISKNYAVRLAMHVFILLLYTLPSLSEI